MYELKFTDAQMKVLSAALVEMPFKLAAPLIQSINEQIAKAQAEVSLSPAPSAESDGSSASAGHEDAQA